MKSGQDFLDISALEAPTLRRILTFARALKKEPRAYTPFTGKTLALIFEKPSTRTRVSFEVGMRQLGGQVTTLSGAEIQLGRGETIGDTARVLSRYVDLIMLRTFDENKVIELAAGSSVPVINGLTNQSHPCQVMADIMTVEEWLGDISSKTIAWVGDGDDNVLTSWIHAASAFKFALKIACPPEFPPRRDVLIAAQKSGANVIVTADLSVVEGADVVITDCWVSMHNSDVAARHELLSPYLVDAALMRRAAPHAIFLHCLPAHRGEEVTNDVIDGPRSAVWDEAENRLHVQKAIMCWCLGAMKEET